MTISVSPPVPLLILAGAGTGAVAAAWILTLFLRGKSAALRHFIWLLAFAASLSALPVARLPTRINLPILPHADARASVLVFQAGAPASMDLLPKPLISASQPAPEPQSGHAPAFNIWWAIWITGAALQFLRICNSHARLRRLAGIAGAAPSADLLLQLNTAKDFFRMKRPVRLLLTPEARLPFCYGVFQPVIVFPMESREWCAERTRVCLTHEMAHIVRGDLFAILVAQCACILCWFNPFVWLGARMLRDEAENAADDLVLSRGIPPETYASNLVAITEECRAFDPAPGFALSIARANRLTPRIVAILDSSLHRKSPRLGTIVSVSLLAGCALVALMTVRLTPAAAPLPDSTPSSGVIHYVYETNPQKIKPKLYNWEVKLDAADSHGGPYEILQVTSPASSRSTAPSARVLIAPEMIIPNSAGIIDFMLYLGQKEPARDPGGYILQRV